MAICEACEGEITENDTYCRHCGASLSGSTVILTDEEGGSEQRSEFGQSNRDGVTNQDSRRDDRRNATAAGVDDPRSKPGLFEAFGPYFLPWGSNEPEMKRRLGGCPGCGEGKALSFRSKSSSRAYVGDPTGADVKCKRCSTQLEAEGFTYTLVNGPSELGGEELTQSECGKLAVARRDDDLERVQELVTEITTEDEAWDPRHPFLSVFASVMLLWAAFWSLSSSGNPVFDFLLFGSLGVLIVPSVRKAVLGTVGQNTKEILTGRLGRVVITGLYSVLVGAAGLLMVGMAAQDPTAPPGAGIMTIVIAFVVASVIVFATRAIR